jgi:hypothetical protein
MRGQRPERHQHAKMVVVINPSEGFTGTVAHSPLSVGPAAERGNVGASATRSGGLRGFRATARRAAGGGQKRDRPERPRYDGPRSRRNRLAMNLDRPQLGAR